MKVGILGGGQLAQMMLETKIAVGQQFLIYTPTAASPTKNLAEQIIAPYDDELQLQKFAKAVDIITYETETIPIKTINYLDDFTKILPKPMALALFQDRLLEKNFFTELEIPTNRYVVIDSNKDLPKAVEALGFPFIIKSRRDGYDGKFQWRVHDQEQLALILKNESFTNCIAEEFVAFEREVSIIGVRSRFGDMQFYHLCENVHKSGILHHTKIIPGDSLQDEAETYCRKAAETLDYVGVMAIEFFVRDGKLLVNEAAPRVHNSGHWTIEAAPTSQFENHLRAIMGLELAETKQAGYALMLNFIGTLDAKPIADELAMQFHDYHKTPRDGRKLAHSTLFTHDQAVFKKALSRIQDCQ